MDNIEHIASLHVAYNNASEDFFSKLSELMEKKYPTIKFEAFHENKLRQRTKAFRVKGGYSARQSPFAVLLNVENKPIKAFYSEAEECTIDNIKFYLDTLITALNKNEYESSNHQHIN